MEINMNYNYHTHTFRCHHGVGEEEDYVKRAIEGGLKRLGFSEHLPLLYKDGYQRAFRVEYDERFLYVNEVNRLKEKYKDQIEIFLGFEMEYYPQFFDQMLSTAKECGAEYLIFGQHFYIPDNPIYNPKYVLTEQEDEVAHLEGYVNSVVEGVKTGIFTYLCHPDIINAFSDREKYLSEMTKICEICKQTNTPMEINFLGIRNNRIYPNPLFWELAGKIGAPVTFGSDAHDPNDVFDKNSLSIAKDMVKKYNLNYIGEPKLKLIK